MIKDLARRLLRNKRVKRRLPNGRDIYVSPDSQLKYLRNSFDNDLTTLASQYSSIESVAWDIGANCGVFSFAFNSAKQIIAVEADPFLVTILQDNLGLSSLPITIIPAAIYDHTGMSEFIIAQQGRASNYIAAASGNGQAGGARSRLMVPTITLDQLLENFGPPTIVKIDVEGAEVEVLKGGRRLLEEARPIIYIEATPKTYPECEEILSRSGYSLTKAAELNWLATPLGL
jgi:FkbM family methyltransferase